MRLAELVELFHRFNRQHKRPRTADFYRDHLRRVVAKYGELDAAELRPFHLLDFRMTWHLVLSVQRLYKWAVDEMDLLQTNPVKKLRRPRLGARCRVLAPAELLRLMRRARADFRRVLLMGRESAARPQELAALRFEELQWEGSAQEMRAALRDGRAWFSLTDYKGRSRRADNTSPRIIPVTPRLGRLLLRLIERRGQVGPVLLSDQGAEWNRNSLRMRMRRAVARAALPSLVHGERVVCYTLRHTALTSVVARGMQTSVVQQLAGHANIRTTARYIHLHRKHLMDTWQAFHARKHGTGKNGTG